MPGPLYFDDPDLDDRAPSFPELLPSQDDLDSVDDGDQDGSEEEPVRPCEFCNEPIPSKRGPKARFCSDGCSRSSKRNASKRTLDRKRRRAEREEMARLDPMPLPDPPRLNDSHKAEQLRRDYARCVKERWIDAQSFLEVRKWHKFDINDGWDGSADDPGWIVVSPTRVWEPLSPVQLDQKILLSNPTGGHFQIRLYESGLREPTLRGGPFYIHLTPRANGANGVSTDMLAIQERIEAARREDRELFQRELSELREQKATTEARLLAIQEEQMRRKDATEAQLRAQVLRQNEADANRQHEQHRWQWQAQQEQFKALQQQSMSATASLDAKLSQLANGGMGSGNSDMMQMMGMMFSAMMKQSENTMNLIVALNGSKGGDRSLETELLLSQLQQANKRSDDLESRFLALLEKRHDPPALPPSKTDRMFEAMQTKVMEQAINMVLDPAEKADAEKKTTVDRIFEMIQGAGIEHVGKAVAKRIAGRNSDDDDFDDEGDDLPEINAAPPAGQAGTVPTHAPSPAASRHRHQPPQHQPQPTPQPRVQPQPAPQQINAPQSQPTPQAQPKAKSSSPALHPSQVKDITDLLVASVDAIESGMKPADFAALLPKDARIDVLQYDMPTITAAAKSVPVPTLKTIKARRWIEDTYQAIQALG